jgi:hypothetical protein
VHKGSFPPAFSPALAVFCLLKGSHSDGGEMESQCHFDLHFPEGKGVERFHVFIGHWYFF